MSVPRTAEAVSLALAASVVVLIAIFSYLDWQHFENNSRNAERTRRIVATVNELLSAVKDAETGQRGFLLTGRDSYLEPYERALPQITAPMGTLGEMTAGHPDEQKQLQELVPLIQRKLDELKQTIELRRTNGADAALQLVLSDRGKQLMDEIRSHCSGISATAYARFRADATAADQSANHTRLVSTGGSALLLFLFCAATAVIGRATKRREQMILTIQKSELQTRRARDLLQTTLSSIGDAVIVTDAAGAVTFLNDVAQALTGWSQADAQGRPLDKVFHIVSEETGAIVENPCAKAIRLGTVIGLANHTLLVAKDGRVVPIDDSAAPIGEAGSIAGVVLVFRDITESRAASKALESSNEALKRSNADLALFAHAASHDLQEPLRMMTSYTQLLGKRYRGKLDRDADEFMEYIVDGGRRMTQLIQDLLSYSQAVDPEQLPERVDCTHNLQQVIVDCRLLLEESGGSVTYSSLPVVIAHTTRISRLFQNFVTNGIKYRKPDIAPHVHVEAREEGGYWQFSVSDNGIGIAPEHQEVVFIVFRRLHTRQLSGTGIGLALCQRIVEGYGGKLWLESEPGVGSTFYFTLPNSERDVIPPSSE